MNENMLYLQMTLTRNVQYHVKKTNKQRTLKRRVYNAERHCISG